MLTLLSFSSIDNSFLKPFIYRVNNQFLDLYHVLVIAEFNITVKIMVSK